MPTGEDLGVELEEVDIETSVYSHCEATIIVPSNRGKQPIKAGAVLESGFGGIVGVGASDG